MGTNEVIRSYFICFATRDEERTTTKATMTSYDVDNGDDGADKSGTDESKHEKGRS